nr:butyrophilin subfamily 3 member A2-like [Misgurnus anguillicaudatus]
MYCDKLKTNLVQTLMSTGLIHIQCRAEVTCHSKMKFMFVTLLIIGEITDLRADQFAVVGPVAPLLAVVGEDVILPCSLKPNISAVNMRVEWSRLDLKDSVVHLYEDHEDKNTNQLQSYRGRTEVFKDELQKGNTSLKLSRVKVSDEGRYKCFIQSKTNYDEITVDLRVEALGSPPVITENESDGSGGLHLQCETKGWYPEPELVWLDSERVTLTSETTDTQRETDGFRVKHMITVYNRDSKYHCRVKLRHHVMETEIITSSQMFNPWSSSGIFIYIVVSVVIATLITLSVNHKRGRTIDGGNGTHYLVKINRVSSEPKSKGVGTKKPHKLKKR